ncbi:MAG: hypothetical protein HDS88_07715 [Bacteroidales bacterium]|nr:hypothetical protein [Bacteroidales bacterium]
MKTLISFLTVIILALCTFNSKAECMSPESGPQTVKEANWLVEKLKIKGDSAVKFNKIYSDYRTEMEAVRAKYKWNEPAVVNGKKTPLTDKQVEENLHNGFKMGHKMIDIREKYYKQFKTVLSPSKIEKMFRYERKIMERKREEVKKREECRKKKKDSVAKKRAEKNTQKSEKRTKKE